MNFQLISKIPISIGRHSINKKIVPKNFEFIPTPFESHTSILSLSNVQLRNYRPKSLDKKKITNPIDPRFIESQSQDLAKKLQKSQEEHDPGQLFELGLHYLKNVEEKKEKAIELFKLAAESDFPDAIYILGWCYLHGEGVEPDIELARKYFLEAAEKFKNALAYFALAEISEDKELQKEYFMKSAKRIYPPAMFEYALLEEDVEKRNYWLNQAAQHGHGAAMIELGINHLYAYSGCAEDPVTARSWFVKAWKKSEFVDSRAGLYAGDCYRKSIGFDEPNPNKAILAYQWSAERGHPMGYQRLGEIYEEIGEYNKSIENYKLAAEAGIPPAQYKYGSHLLNPEQENISEAQKEEGISYIQDAAKAGLPHAEYFLATLILNRALKGDNSDVARLMKSASSKDFVPAIVFIGDSHLEGEFGFPKNVSIAIQYYKRAAEQGDDVAQYNLGAALMNGEGIEKDEDEAAYWLQQSSSKGNIKAKQLLRENDFVCSPGL